MPFKRSSLIFPSRSSSQNVWLAYSACILITISVATLLPRRAIAQGQLPLKTESSKASSEREAPTAVAQPSIRTEEEIEKLKTIVADQQKRIDQLEQTLNDQKTVIEQGLHLTLAKASPENVVQPANKPEAGNVGRAADAASSSNEPIRQTQTASDSPLSLRLGQ